MTDSDSDDIWFAHHNYIGGLGTATTRHGAPHRFRPTPKEFKKARKKQQPIGFVDFSRVDRHSTKNKARRKDIPDID